MVISLSHRLVIFAFLLASLSTAQSSAPDVEYTPHPSDIGSPYVPIGNWVYPALDRLIARGYIKSAFQGLRPWTRITCAELVTEARVVIPSLNGTFRSLKSSDLSMRADNGSARLADSYCEQLLPLAIIPYRDYLR